MYTVIPLVRTTHSGFISEKVTRRGELHVRGILGGNMKTRVAVYEEGVFNLRGGAKLFKGGGKCPLSPPKRSPDIDK